MSREPAIPTVNLAGAVFDGPVDANDPVELLHEASKLHPSVVRRQMRGVWRLERSPDLLLSTRRAVRRDPTLPRIDLPEPDFPAISLDEALRARRSVRRFGAEPVTLAETATLLAAAYGVIPGTRDRCTDLPPRRTAPSAGGLYPLELFVVAQRVAGLTAAVLHYDPLAHAVERLAGEPDWNELSPLAEEAEGAALVVVVAAVFWRSRFKYGLRAYRFTLLEAGHVAQNLLLAATGLGLGGLVLGGFYDAKVDSLLGLDGLHESSLIAVGLGRPAA